MEINNNFNEINFKKVKIQMFFFIGIQKSWILIRQT